MTTWLVLLAGIAVVVGGIIWLRIHAFVALVLGAMVVALCTPAESVFRSQAVREFIPVEHFSADPPAVAIEAGDSVSAVHYVVVEQGRDRQPAIIGQVDSSSVSTQTDQTESEPTGEHSDAVWFSIRAFGATPHGSDSDLTIEDSLLSGTEIQAAQLRLVPKTAWDAAGRLTEQSAIQRVTTALGNACGKLAILIVAACIIGACLLESGAADRIVQTSLSVFTERFAPLAFTVSGFILAIPVFFDTVFLLMIPLGKSMARRTGQNYLLYVLSILVGATMAHSLVPPTPGPLLIASELEISVLQMALGGCIVGGCGALGGLLFAVLVNRKTTLPLPENEGESAPDSAPSQLPSLAESLLPIVVPIFLIALETQSDRIVSLLSTIPQISGAQTTAVLSLLGNKSVALLIGAAIAMITYRRIRHPEPDSFRRTMNSAVLSAGTIVLVTSAGSAFGQMLQQTSVAELLAELPGSSPVSIVLAAFLVTTLVRTAQGSATVAMITSAGVFAPIVTGGLVDVHPLYVALAIGCGSKPISWMNDSGFLVITRTSGMSDQQGLSYVTTTLIVAAVVGLSVILFGVIWFPDLPAILPA